MAMKILKFLFFALFFIVAVVVFLPKKNLYYFAEEELANSKIVIGNERVEEHPFGLNFEHADIFVEGIRAAKVMDATLKTYLVRTVFEANKIRLSGMAKSFLPTRIEHLDVHYDLWHPLKLYFSADGEFGKAKGSVLLQKRKMILMLYPSKTMQSKYARILRRMKKHKGGVYGYEYGF